VELLVGEVVGELLVESEIVRVIEDVLEIEGVAETDTCWDVDTEVVAVRLGVSDVDMVGVLETGGVTDGVILGVTDPVSLIE